MSFTVEVDWPHASFEVTGTLSCVEATIVLKIPSLQDVTDTCVFYEASIDATALDLQTVASCFGTDIDLESLNAPQVLKDAIAPLLEVSIENLLVMISPNW